MSKNNRYDSDVYARYLKEIKNTKPLTIDEEKVFLEKIKNGDLIAKEEFFKRHLKFVVSVAIEYHNDFLDLNDLINEGNLGLMQALDKYDFDVKTRFMSYAVFWVRQKITSSISKNSRTIRLPENIIQDVKKEVNKKEVATCIPLIYDSNEDTYNISDYYMVNDETDEKTEILEKLNKIIRSLKKRDREIIERYFGLNGYEPLNLEDIGEEMGLSKERVRQIKTNIIRKLKHLSRDLIKIKNM